MMLFWILLTGLTWARNKNPTVVETKAVPVRRQPLSSGAGEAPVAALLNVTAGSGTGTGAGSGNGDSDGEEEGGGEEEEGEDGEKGKGDGKGKGTSESTVKSMESMTPNEAADELCGAESKLSGEKIMEALKAAKKEDSGGLVAKRDKICKEYVLAKKAELAAAWEAKATYWEALVAIENRDIKEAEEKAKAIGDEAKKAMGDFHEKNKHHAAGFAPTVALGLLLLLGM